MFLLAIKFMITLWITFLTKIGDDYSTTSGRIIHRACQQDCPGLCTNDWTFHDEIYENVDHADQTQRENKLDVSCGKINKFILSRYMGGMICQ